MARTVPCRGIDPSSILGQGVNPASKNPDKKAMKRFGFKELPCGFIVGKVKLVDVKKYNNEEDHKKDKDSHLASSYWGNYGFNLENPQRIEKIPVNGKLGFWDF